MNNYPMDFLRTIIKKEDWNDTVRDKGKEWVNIVMIPYHKRFSEGIRMVLNLQNIKVFFCTNNTLRFKPVTIKDTIQKKEQQNCIYIKSNIVIVVSYI